MSKVTKSLTFSGSHVPLVINDVANLIVASASITGVIVAAITRSLQEIAVQGISEIILTINRVASEIEIITFQRKIRVRLQKFQYAIAMYSEAIADAENSSHYEPVL